MNKIKSTLNRKHNRGYTLAELLIVVGILVILFAVGVPALLRIRRNLRQTELDSKAEIIYQSAQNRLAELSLSGSSYMFQSDVMDVKKLGYVPDDAGEEDDITDTDIYYITSETLSTSGSAASAVMTGDVVDEELMNNHWVIEYNPERAIVYAVFYSETKADCAADYPSSKYDTQYRYKDNRLKDGAIVGYYGGGSGAAGSTVTDMQPSLTIVNEEKLQANATCTVPVSVTDYPVFKIDLSDTNGHTVTVYYAYYACTSEYMTEIAKEAGSNEVIYSADAMKKLGRTYSLTLTLDDLSNDATRFVNLFGANSTYDTKLDAGTPLTVTVTAMCPGNYKVSQNLNDSKITNSLFDDSTEVDAENHTIKARIRYGRHLQNLDTGSGVVNTVTKAEQISDIIFTDQTAQTGTKDWYETYSGSFFNGCDSDESADPLFKPITNTNLLLYDGAPSEIDGAASNAKFRIANLQVNTLTDTSANDHAGLFDTLGVAGKSDADAQVLQNMILTGAKVTAGSDGETTGTTGSAAIGTTGSETTGTTGSETTNVTPAAGALVGEIAGNTVLTNCRSYLTKSDIMDHSNRDVWITGTDAGGLAGRVSGGTLTLEKCSASSVVGDFTLNTATGRVTNFEADNVGGLIGSVSAGTVSLSESYADSYLGGTNAGGLVGTSIPEITITNCYAAGYETNDITGSGAGAGLVLGKASMANSYTILYRQYMNNADTGTYTYFSTAKEGSVEGCVYYAAGSMTEGENTSVKTAAAALDEKTTSGIAGMEIAELTEALNGSSGTAFQVNTSDSSAYNLMGQSLTTYTYPELTNVTHYGDWNASFQVGALVYYERYSDGDYGFYGANIDSTLKDQMVYGDGYGFAFLKDGTELPDHLTVTVSDTTGTAQAAAASDTTKNTKTVTLSLSSITPYEVKDTEGRAYSIYPMPLSVVNITTPSASFYLKAEVKTYTKASENDADLSGIDYYYFNPHFAKTVVSLTDSQAAAPALTGDTYIFVRSPRQLYMLSQYYSTYRDATALCTYRQECNLDYNIYLWSTYYDTGVASVKVQSPIGRDEKNDKDVTFNAGYDGRYHWIRNISFTTENGNYVGMFGQNEGRISNLVLRASYKDSTASNSYVSRTGNVSDSQKVYIGVLAGFNTTTGTVINCAAAGHDISGSDATIHAYRNTKVYAGGLVGRNEGSISDSTADIPQIRLSTTYADAFAGGLTGYNTGAINNSYALGHIEVVYTKGGSVSISGFAGANRGVIKNSYCATALTAVGSTTESYGFAPAGGKVQNSYYLNNGSFSYIGALYPFEYNKGEGTSAAYSELIDLAEESPALFSYDFNSTDSQSENYPFRAVVTNSSGKKVHYGDWLDDEAMGACGIFYWEHEQYGENNGYHFTYLGIESGKAIGGTTLCEAHDDGGIITEYGYGYYERNQGSTTLSMSNAVYSKTTYNETASGAIQKQLQKNNGGNSGEYYFYAYTTRTQSEAGDDDYVCMSGTSANSTWTLRCTPTGSSTADTYTYSVCPFFANAMQYSGGSVSVTDSAGLATDYSKTPGLTTNTEGASGNPYEIRSIRQLQFINWKVASTYSSSGHTGDVNTYVDVYSEYTGQDTCSGNDFPYECASGTSQKKYSQTHDLDNNSTGTSTGFYPLGKDGRSFKCAYNGNSYQIKNLKISVSSMCYVGLFGEVGGGTSLTNMILTADEGQGLIESTYNATSYSEPVVGSLVGMEWVGGSQSDQITVKNCASSGYIVRYAGKITYSGFYRYISVGGLIGSVFHGSIENCMAANTVTVKAATTGTLNYRQQLGGLIGTSGDNQSKNGASTIKNCYSGGEIIPDTGSSSATWLCGGLAGNAAGNVSNNTPIGVNNSTISNCYSYCNVPASSYSGTTTTYPLAGYATNGSNNYFLIQNQVSTDPTGKATGFTFTQMEDGTLLKKLNGTSGTGGVSSQDGTYHNVSTTEGTHNAAIDGKYSFPINDALNGKNYPFPAIVVQKDLIFSTTENPVYVYVHYGDWPITGPYFTDGLDSMDIFADMNSTGTYASYATKEYKLYVNGASMSAPEASDFTSSDKTIARVVKVGTMTNDNDGKGDYYPVTVEALNTGSAEISLKDTEASFNIEVTANINIQAVTNPDPMKLATDAAGTATLYAVTALNEDGTIPDTAVHYETAGSTTWSIGANDSFSYAKTTAKNVWKITRDAMGAAEPEAVFQYDYHGVSFTGTTFIQVLEPDMVGLSDGTSYNAAQIGNQDRSGTITTYSTDAPDSGTGDFFLYLTRSDSDLSWDSMTIEGITVDGVAAEKTPGTGTTVYKTNGTDSYKVVMKNTAFADSGYRYLTGTISCITTEDLNSNKKNVPLTAVVSDINGVKYTLNITLSQVKTQKALDVIYSITLDANGGAFGSADKVTLTQSGAGEAIDISSYYDGDRKGVREGYTLTGWNTKADGTGVSLTSDTSVSSEELEAFDIAGTTVLYAQWKLVGYQLTLVSGSIYSKTFTVTADTDSVSPDPGANGTKTLEGWYTSNDGKGSKVLNADGTIYGEDLSGYTSGGKFALQEDKTLYARWKSTVTRYELTDTLTTGDSDYLIVSTNSAGTGYALALGDTYYYGYRKYIGSQEVTVNSEGNVKYIEDADQLPVWNYTKNKYLTNGDWYLYGSSDTNFFGSSYSTTSWSCSTNALYSGNKKYYLYYDGQNKKFALIKNTAKNVYFYVKKETTVYTFDHDVS